MIEIRIACAIRVSYIFIGVTFDGVEGEEDATIGLTGERSLTKEWVFV